MSEGSSDYTGRHLMTLAQGGREAISQRSAEARTD